MDLAYGCGHGACKDQGLDGVVILSISLISLIIRNASGDTEWVLRRMEEGFKRGWSWENVEDQQPTWMQGLQLCVFLLTGRNELGKGTG